MSNAILAQSAGGSGSGLQVKTLKNVSSASVSTIYQHQWYGYSSSGRASLLTSTETPWVAKYPLVWFAISYIDYTISGSVSGSATVFVGMTRPGDNAGQVTYSETLSLPSTSSGRLTPSGGVGTMMDIGNRGQYTGPEVALALPTGGTSYTATLVGKVQALTLGS